MVGRHRAEGVRLLAPKGLQSGTPLAEGPRSVSRCRLGIAATIRSMWTALVWNMGLGSPPRKNAARNWGRLAELMEERSVDVALLNEASVPVPSELMACYAEMGTQGRDRLRNHAERRRWFYQWTEMRNAPAEQGRCLAELAKHRNAARYTGEALPSPTEQVARVD